MTDIKDHDLHSLARFIYRGNYKDTIALFEFAANLGPLDLHDLGFQLAIKGIIEATEELRESINEYLRVRCQLRLGWDYKQSHAFRCRPGRIELDLPLSEPSTFVYLVITQTKSDFELRIETRSKFLWPIFKLLKMIVHDQISLNQYIHIKLPGSEARDLKAGQWLAAITYLLCKEVSSANQVIDEAVETNETVFA